MHLSRQWFHKIEDNELVHMVGDATATAYASSILVNMAASSSGVHISIHDVGDVRQSNAPSWCRTPHLSLMIVEPNRPELPSFQQKGLRLLWHRVLLSAVAEQ